MAGYAKLWDCMFSDPWFVGLPLSHRGMWLQLIVRVHQQTDKGYATERGWVGWGSATGSEGKTARKILGKFQDDLKVEIKELEGGAIEVFVKHYEYWQGLSKIEDMRKHLQKSGKSQEKARKIPANEKLTLNRTEQHSIKHKTPPRPPFQKVIDDLNSKIKSRYTLTPKHRELIQARANEGYGLEDFQKVHSNMIKAWLDDPKMREYLRPVTLYSNKFESYLNRISETPAKARAPKPPVVERTPGEIAKDERAAKDGFEQIGKIMGRILPKRGTDE